MKVLLGLLLLTTLVGGASAESTATQTLQLTILPAPAQIRGQQLPTQAVRLEPRDADSKLLWTRETFGSQEVVTVTIVPSGEALARP